MRRAAPKLCAFGLPLLVVLLFLPFTVAARAQVRAQTEREQAISLFEANNFVAALPLLEKVALVSPNDPVILSRLGFAIYAASTTAKDATTRQAARKRAREVLLKSQAAGDDSNLTKIALGALSRDDVAAIPFSSMKAADSEIRKGENAFVGGNLDEALEAYKRALAIDPQLYEAALYAGDVEFKKAYMSKDERFRQEHFDQAGIWFAKAVAIDQNRETAYRYWGDALDSQGKFDEARDRFVEAIIAEPYSRTSYVGLTQWADRHDVSMGHPKIEVPTNVNSKKPGEINITLEDSGLTGKDNDGSAAWLMYGIIRASWMDGKDAVRSERFAKTFPDEPAYRHSLAEEIAAFRGVLESVKVQLKDNPKLKLSPSLDNLVALSEADLLEAYVLFVRPDEGISRDYPEYRKTNRDKLRRYWTDFVIAKQRKF